MNVVFLSNSFPEPSESYIADEIRELAESGMPVTPCSVWRSQTAVDPGLSPITIFPLHFVNCLQATWLCLRRFGRIHDLVARAMRGPEPPGRRLRTLAHTWLGAYFAVRMRTPRPGHIHVHHGYFASWVGMVAARLLNIGFSLTLHGSDVLVRADYLDTKLRDCRFCFTISEFNRGYILEHYPQVDASKVLVQRLGVDLEWWRPVEREREGDEFHIVSVGRLHPVKNLAFLLLACRVLKSSGTKLRCTIAGEGEERPALERLIADLDLANEVRLAGHVSRDKLPGLYASAHVVALTSHSEGIPLTLMEAMAMGCLVLAPAITGIPELVSHGKTGFLYQPGSMEDMILELRMVAHGSQLLDEMRVAARQHILRYFNRRTNLARFCKSFCTQVSGAPPLSTPAQSHEDPILQQI